jgi:hypothetical protein
VGDGFLCQEMMLFCVYVSLTALCRALGLIFAVMSMDRMIPPMVAFGPSRCPLLNRLD